MIKAYVNRTGKQIIDFTVFSLINPWNGYNCVYYNKVQVIHMKKKKLSFKFSFWVLSFDTTVIGSVY